MRAEVARVEVQVDNKILADETGDATILRVEVEHEFGSPSTCRIETADLDPLDLDWVEGSAVREGRPIRVGMGLGESTWPVFAGELLGIDLDVTPSDATRVTLFSLDRLHRLARARKTRVFTDQRDSQIAAAIAREHGLRCSGPFSSVLHSYVMQRESTDLAFLLARARGLGWVVRVEADALYFGPRNLLTSAAAAAELGKNLLELHVSTSLLGQVGTMVARGWDPAIQRESLGSATQAQLGRRQGSLTGARQADASFRAEASAVVGVPIVGLAAARAAAMGALESLALDYVTCHGRMLGAAALRPGDVLAVVGVGTRFSGDYWLTRVAHSFGRDGFVSEFEGRRMAT